MILKQVKRINARNHSQVLIPRMEHEALGHSRAQGYKLLKRVWTQTKDDVDETGIDRLELLAWSIQKLMSAAGQAKQQKNPGAVVACIKQLVWMTGLGMNSTAGQRGHRSHR